MQLAGDSIAVEHDKIVHQWLDDPAVVVDVWEQTERHAGEPLSLAGALCFEPAPFLARGAIPQRWRMTRVCHHKQPSTGVPTDRDHRGVVHVIEFFPHRTIEILHQSDLCQLTQIPLHELSKRVAERRHCVPMAAHISKRDPGDVTTRTQRYVMDIAARVTRSRWHCMHPRRQPRQLEQRRGPRVARRCFRTGQVLRDGEHGESCHPSIRRGDASARFSASRTP